MPFSFSFFAGFYCKKMLSIHTFLVIVCSMLFISIFSMNWIAKGTNFYVAKDASPPMTARHKRAAADEWAGWSDWSLCTQTAGVSSQTRSRKCSNSSGKCAGGEFTQARSCLFSNSNASLGKARSTFPAQQTPLSAEWRPWSAWSDCNSVPLSAEPAFRSRWRECIPCSSNFTNQCLPCQGPSFQQMACQKASSNTNGINLNYNGEQPFWMASPSHDSVQPFRPSVQQVSGNSCDWSQWGGWSQCTATCGIYSRRYRARSCDCPSRCVGGGPIEEELCSGQPPCNSPAAVLTMLRGAEGIETPMQESPAKQVIVSYPCSLCPAQYPLPCYTCIALPNPQAGKRRR